jgi:SAM-dependent methyltransferase
MGGVKNLGIMILSQTAVNCFVQLADPRGWWNDEIFAHTAYQRVLQREPDPDGLQHYTALLKAGALSRPRMIWNLLNSSEFRYRFLTVGQQTLHERLHAARCDLVKRLPPADDILDLGGGNALVIEGSLIAMGYPHPLKRITIIDLPPDQRFAQLEAYSQERHGEWITTPRAQVRYIHGSMTDLHLIADSSMDLVWMGQSIEHVTEPEARHVIAEAFRVLKPGGHFCFDTPNAALARLQVPDGFIFPEHKREYRIDELQERVQAAGFEVAEVKGIAPMPNTWRRGKFDPMELYLNTFVSDKAECSYLIYIKCRKPT